MASQEYKDLLGSALIEAIDQEPRKRAIRCPETRPRSEPSLFDQSFLGFLTAAFLLPQRLWESSKEEKLAELPPLHPAAQLIQNEMLALHPFAILDPGSLSRLAVAVEIPSWLTGTEEACHIASAAERTFSRLIRVESPPSSAYTAAGYELCRISYEAFDCSGPGRIATLEFDGNVAVLSMVQTPLSNWFANPITFSATAGKGSESITAWVNEFIDSQSPDKLMLIGSNTDDPSFADAIAKSRAVSYLDGNSSLPASQILALGAAQSAKEGVELQIDDCGEPEECQELRRKADVIAGTYRPLRPSTWPVAGPRHAEL